MNGNALELVNVSKRYDQVTALEDINLSIKKGEFVTILGPSGSGKSTLLKIIGGFEEPSEGEVYINGNIINGVPPYRRPTSMVFQDLALFPHLNVFNNIAYGLKIRKKPFNVIREKVQWITELLQIHNLLDRKITQLSGGQQQRVALARSLVLEPEILLLDEPLGPLDLKLRREMQLELRKIQKRLSSTWVYVTHDHEEAMVMSDRIVIIKNGRIQAVGKIREIYERPKTKFIAEFLGETNYTECRVESKNGACLIATCGEISFEIPCDTETSVGQKLSLIIRPEKIRISREPSNCSYNFTNGTISEIIYKGAYVDIKVTTSDAKVFTARTFDSDFRVGERVYVSWKKEDIVVVSE